MPLVLDTSPPFKLVSRERHPQDTVIRLPNGLALGDGNVAVIAGPCAVESEAQLMDTARAVSQAGATVLRGGAFKPRTSPYSFQGLGEAGLQLLAQAGRAYHLAVVTEALDAAAVDLVEEYADIIQIGSRNMQNFPLLKRVGRSVKPVFLKRGMAATIQEWLLAAEYILAEGNAQVILCERGLRSFDPVTRNTVDMAAIPVVKALSHLPVFLDPSHGTGQRELVIPVGRAGIAAGAAGLMVEVHYRPDEALSDGSQSLTPEGFQQLMGDVDRIARALGRRLVERPFRERVGA